MNVKINSESAQLLQIGRYQIINLCNKSVQSLSIQLINEGFPTQV